MENKKNQNNNNEDTASGRPEKAPITGNVKAARRLVLQNIRLLHDPVHGAEGHASLEAAGNTMTKNDHERQMDGTVNLRAITSFASSYSAIPLILSCILAFAFIYQIERSNTRIKELEARVSNLSFLVNASVDGLASINAEQTKLEQAKLEQAGQSQSSDLPSVPAPPIVNSASPLPENAIVHIDTNRVIVSDSNKRIVASMFIEPYEKMVSPLPQGAKSVDMGEGLWIVGMPDGKMYAYKMGLSK